MIEKITPHLRSMLTQESIRNQYVVSPFEDEHLNRYNDPLMEDAHEVVKGLVHKYTNRALIKVSYLCAAHCRFCTRIRQIGNKKGTLDTGDIEAIAAYLTSHPEIDDVILSGGDPFYTPHVTLEVLSKLKEIESIKIFRIGTRLPFHSPRSFERPIFEKLFGMIEEIGSQKPFYILLHVEHAEELKEESMNTIGKIRSLPVTLLSQTVFLKDINDNYDALFSLFRKLYHLGIIPYYLYHCDNVRGLEHFQVSIDKEKQIVKELRKSLSGIALPLHVEDLEDGYGKEPL